ncbi:MAG TPA: YgaP-like transmembrane domain, partial [Planctomycetaceae bacterium]
MSTGSLSPMLGEPRLPGSAPPAPVPPRPTAWKNVGDDERLLSLLAGGALVGAGAAKRGWLGLGLAAIGGSLVYRALTGHCYTYQALGVSTVPQHRGVRPEHGVRVTKSLHIARSPEEVAGFWGQLTGLPKIMRHLDGVDQLEGNRSHWVAKVFGMRFEWDAETTAYVEGREIRWRSLPGGDVDTEGAVKFEP